MRFDAELQTSGLHFAALPYGTKIENASIDDIAQFVKQVVETLPVSVPEGLRSFSFSIRPAKETFFEVWCSMDSGEIMETRFTQGDLAIKHADALLAQELARYKTPPAPGVARGYYVLRRRGRAKPVLHYRAGMT